MFQYMEKSHKSNRSAITFHLVKEAIKPRTERNGTGMHNTDVDTGYAMENWC